MPPSSVLRSNTVLPEAALFTTIKSPLGWMASPVTGPASASQRKRVTFAAIGVDAEWGAGPPSKSVDWSRASMVSSMGPLGTAALLTPASNRPVWKTPLPPCKSLSVTCTSKVQLVLPAVQPSGRCEPAVTAPLKSMPSTCSVALAIPLTSVIVPLTWTLSE